MSKKKNKFDLTHLVQSGRLKEGEWLSFVSDPSMKCCVNKMPNNEYKVLDGKEITTIHGFVQKCLGQEPPDHASKWLRSSGGEILFDIWHRDDELQLAA